MVRYAGLPETELLDLCKEYKVTFAAGIDIPHGTMKSQIATKEAGK